MFKKLLLVASAAAGIALSAAPAQASLITNGSFETGNLSGWTSTYGSLNPFGTTYGSGMDGTYWAWLAGFETPITLSQTVSGLTVGTNYALTFIMASEFTHADQVSVSVGGPATLFTAPAYTVGGPLGAFWDNWVSQTYNFTATSASQTISFSTVGLNVGGYDVGIDKVSLSAISGGVPEPTTWALMLMGFGGLGLALRQRRTAVAA